MNRHFFNRSEYLAHHGVRGQKWGIRNGPPYPVRSTTTPKINREYLTKVGRIKVNDLPHYEVGDLYTLTNGNVPGWSATTALVGGHDYDWQEMSYTINTEDPTRQINRPVADILSDAMGDSSMKEYAESHGKTYDSDAVGNNRMFTFGEDDPIWNSVDRGQVSDYTLKTCNPTFGNPGTTQNCAKCSAALELGLHGIAVSAGRQTYPSSVDAMSWWFKDAKREDFSADTAEASIKAYGKKTSGTIGIQYPTGGGHAMHWTVDDEGTFEIQDGQNGRRFKSVEEMTSTYGADTSQDLSVFRLDNCEPDYEHLSEDSVIRGNAQNRYAAERSNVVNRWSKKEVKSW